MRTFSRTLLACLVLMASPVFAQEPVPAQSRAPLKIDLTKLEVTGGKPAPTPVFGSRSGAVKGALIGFPIGVVAGVTIGAEACLHEPRWHCAVKGGLIYSAIGALIGVLR